MNATANRPKTCGARFTAGLAPSTEKCARLPMHNGPCTSARPRGLQAAKQRETAKLAIKAAPVAAKRSSSRPAGLRAKVAKVNGEWVAVLVNSAPGPVTHTTILPMAKGKPSRRRVGAPAKRSKTVANRVSGTPRLSRPSIG